MGHTGGKAPAKGAAGAGPPFPRPLYGRAGPIFLQKAVDGNNRGSKPLFREQISDFLMDILRTFPSEKDGGEMAKNRWWNEIGLKIIYEKRVLFLSFSTNTFVNYNRTSCYNIV